MKSARESLAALIVLVTVACALPGCTRDEAAATSAATRRDAGPETPVGNVELGREVFAVNCATCHGATGIEGGVGPSLRDEKARKDYDATIAWIEDPLPPMPKLFPSPVSEDSVRDVAAYVQSL